MDLIGVDGRVALLRACGPLGESWHEQANGFRWPLTVGAEVTAPDWSDARQCGHGLHGLVWGCGDRSNLKGGTFVVFSSAPEDVVEIDAAKAKVRVARVEYVGDEAGACAALARLSSVVVRRGEVPAWALSRDGYGDGDGDGDGDGYGDGYGVPL